MNDKLEDFKNAVPDYAKKSEESFQLFKQRHSAEHVLTQAMLNIFGKDKLTMAMGPATEDGFYFDFESLADFQVSENMFKQIQNEMNRIIKADLPITKKEVSITEARELFKDNKYKQEWLDEIEEKDAKVTIYFTGDPEDKNVFADLCKGPHLDSTKEIGVTKLLSLAGAYWRGDEKNQMLTRIYGTAFSNKEDLEQYLWRIEEAKKRDHRKLGNQLDLFTFSELVGSGLPMFTPRGTVLREELNRFSQELRENIGFQKVWSPHITKKELYEKSGHWDKFGDELFLVKSQETSDQMVLKPMNCPHHQQVYAAKPRSYKDLPLKFMETTTDYRDEKAGELQGLSRVRALTQDDSHSFVTKDQIEEVYQELIDITEKFFSTLGMKYKVRLSYRDPNEPEKYLGDDELWESAQAILLKIAKKNNLDYYEAEGEAAFYGPKMDFMVLDALGREWQLATPQLDFNQPARFELTYTDSNGHEVTPIMIHYALMGSLERFLSVFIEHTAGNFPAWVSPEQVRIIPISDQNVEYAERLKSKLDLLGVRSEIDSESERMQKKVKKAQELKIPYMLILGKNEEAEESVSIRYRSGEQENGVKFDVFAEKLLDNINNREIEIKL